MRLVREGVSRVARRRTASRLASSPLKRIVAAAASRPNALKALAAFETIIFVGARVPVAMFGYADGISRLVDPAAQVMSWERMEWNGMQ